MLQGFIGAKSASAPQNIDVERNYVNVNPQAAQVSSFEVTGFVGSATYTITFNGVDYAMVEDGTGAGVGDVGDQFTLFLNDLGAIRGVAIATNVAGVVTLTGLLPGFTFTLTEADGNLGNVTAVTAADDADPVAFGSAVVRTGFATATVDDVEDGMELGALATVASFTAQVDTWTVADPGAGQFIGATLKIEGLNEVISERVIWDTNLDTTLDNLATVLNGALTDLGYNAYVTVAGPAGAPAAGELAFTAAIAGVEYASMVTSDDAAGYPAITVVSNKAFGTSFAQGFAGAALRVTDQEGTYSLLTGQPSTVSYEANSQMLILEKGEIWVDNSETITYGQQVFVDLTAADGQFYNSAGTDRVPLPLSRAEWVKGGRSLDGETIAILRLK
jgi:hypothetical protein